MSEVRNTLPSSRGGVTATTPTKPASAQGAVADPTSFIWTDDLHTALEAIGVPVRKVRMTELLLLWRGLTSAAQFAAAPAPAASPPSPGEVDAAALREKIASFIDENAEVRGDHPSDFAILVNADELAASIVKLIPLAWLPTALASDATANSKAGDEDVRGALAKVVAERDEALQELERVCSDREYIIGWNDGFEHAGTVPAKLQFPTMLRKMWSGAEVQKWIDNEMASFRARTLATPETESRDGKAD